MPCDHSPSGRPAAGITPLRTVLLALACGLIAANLYYAQPLTALVAASLSVPPTAAGLLVTVTQIGYGLGLLLVVPLGDLFENRRLAVVLIAIDAVALLGIASSGSAGIFLGAALIVGTTSATVQILLPFTAHFTTDADRGRIIGALTSGLMLGIMLARPLASVVAFYFGWRAIFVISAGLLGLLAMALALAMPRHQPASKLRYGDILRSLPVLWRELPLLRRRAAYHAALYASFSLFWTAVPLLLAGPRFGFTQRGIAAFALAGAGGVVIAPIAGWIADKGWSRPATGAAIGAVFASFLVAAIGGASGSVAALALAAVLVDFGLVTNFVLSQRSIYAPRPESRSRIGGVFTAIFFTGGAAGSAVASSSLVLGGWHLTTGIGMALAAAAFLFYLGEVAQVRARTVDHATAAPQS
jgi:predicted MFS family arabinose efflux permease